ncbi:MAG: hypothetical protein Q7U48_13705 [Hydrogenophaga sp.]|nr:hypothetical protein [Hydrogenophaga sp.]
MSANPRFPVTYCSQCGGTFGPGDSGLSHCDDHRAMTWKFTPGPWVLHPTSMHPAVRSVGTETAGPKRICTVGSMNGNKTDEANAHLISAAPELLDVLIMIREAAIDMRGLDFNLTTEQWAQVHTVIAKAHGDAT